MNSNTDREKICPGCRSHHLSYGNCLYPPSIEKTKYTPKGLVCPCSTCLVKMVCGSECNVIKQYKIIDTFIKSLKGGSKVSINIWYGFEDDSNDFFKDVDMKAISWKIRELVFLRKTTKEAKKNGFEKREQLGDKYWQDSRWKKVRKLRSQNKQLEANGLVGQIRYNWGLE